jgi:hypothetical protein
MGEEPSLSDIRQERVLRAVTRVAGFRRGLEVALEAIPDEEAWLARWLAPEQEADLLLAAIERQYERVINALQDEIFDVLEAEAASQGKAPAPPVRGDEQDAARWLSEAVRLGLIEQPAKNAQTPGRWERHVIFGWLSSELATTLRDLSYSRQVFAHRYTRVDDAERGRDLWGSIDELRASFPRISDDIDRAIAELWPGLLHD